MLVVYHGATCAVSQPLCHVGRANLDFGQGFYVTDLRQQAIGLAQHLPNNQMYLLSQSLVSECLRYVGTEALTDRELQKGN